MKRPVEGHENTPINAPGWILAQLQMCFIFNF
jgi:hypothetical protein